MSTYLQLCQRAARECGISQDGTLPTAVTGQTGQLLDLVKWVEQAYTDIQNTHGGQWRWLRRGFTLPTVASTRKYAYTAATDVLESSAIDRFGRWILNDKRIPPKIYLTSSGVGSQTWMVWAPWDYFNQIYGIGTQTEAFPAHITIDPQDNIQLGPTPDAVYTVTGEYWRSPQILAANSDTPEMPVQFHDLIMWEAVERYGYDESASEVVLKAQKYGGKMMRDLENNQLPAMRKRGPLA